MLKPLICAPFSYSAQVFNKLKSVCDFALAVRLLLFKVFFVSALTKIQSWDSTLTLFKYEYQVPLLPPEWAAILGTAAELTLPIFIVLGLGGRLPAFFLFLFNVVAVIAYRSFLFSEAGFYGLIDHLLWGYMLLVLMAYGSGKVSLDSMVCKLCKKYTHSR